MDTFQSTTKTRAKYLHKSRAVLGWFGGRGGVERVEKVHLYVCDIHSCMYAGWSVWFHVCRRAYMYVYGCGNQRFTLKVVLHSCTFTYLSKKSLIKLGTNQLNLSRQPGCQGISCLSLLSTGIIARSSFLPEFYVSVGNLNFSLYVFMKSTLFI